jgi:hypothetical protein
MTEHPYTLVAEPEGDGYSSLLRFLFERASMCSLVVQLRSPLNGSAARFLDVVHPYLLQAREKSSWPGTVLDPASTASVRYYAADRSLLEEARRN